jgi:hypothetical protein
MAGSASLAGLGSSIPVYASIDSLTDSLLQSARLARSVAGSHGLLGGATQAGSMLGAPASVTLTLGQAAAGPARGFVKRRQVRSTS